ncbi:kinase-like domain-containing protein [Scleroderma citrinum]
MVTPWMELGNAYEYVQDKEVDPCPLLGGIADGICYLHNHRPRAIFHGDLKGRNVLISSDGHPKIVDFGNSFSPLIDTVPKGIAGESTLRWMAPESIDQGGIATAEGDVWAFGMTTLELFTRKEPFHDIPYRSIRVRIDRGPPEHPSEESTVFRMTEEWWNLCVTCWSHNAQERPQMSAITNRIRTVLSGH